MEKKKLSFVYYDGKRYKVKFNKEAVAKLKATGFIREYFYTREVSSMYKSFHYALKANHPYITKQKSFEMLKSLNSKGKILEYLIEDYDDVCS